MKHEIREHDYGVAIADDVGEIYFIYRDEFGTLSSFKKYCRYLLKTLNSKKRWTL